MKSSNLLAVYLDRPLDKLEDKYGSETFNEWLCGGGNLERVYYVFELADKIDEQIKPLEDIPLSVFLYNIIELNIKSLFECKMLANEEPPTAIEATNWINTEISQWGSKYA